MFELFDPDGDISVREGVLPHWFQPSVTYFVTFRTADSIPQNLLRSWHGRRDEWLRRRGLDPAAPTWQSQVQDDPEWQREYHFEFTHAFMTYLDRGHGECALRESRIAGLVATCLRQFDGERYYLGDFVVMPNHVHLLTCLRGSTEIETLCRSWKKFSAGEINRALGRKGRFWQEESFDHLVRSPEQFDYLRQYIASKPIKADLKPGEYLYWKREK